MILKVEAEGVYTLSEPDAGLEFGRTICGVIIAAARSAASCPCPVRSTRPA